MKMPYVPSANESFHPMPAKSTQLKTPRLRLDAVALTLFAVPIHSEKLAI
jgi:hypothetical protein